MTTGRRTENTTNDFSNYVWLLSDFNDKRAMKERNFLEIVSYANTQSDVDNKDLQKNHEQIVKDLSRLYRKNWKMINGLLVFFRRAII